MKKYFLVFLFFSAAAILYLSFPLNSAKGFVSIEDKKFKLNGKDFYPVAVNYIISTRADKNGMWACPYFGYSPDSVLPPDTKEACILQLKADMELIKEIGFNAVRFVGIGEESVNKKTGFLSVYTRNGERGDTIIPLTSEANYEKYFNALEELFNAASSAGLKIIFLIRVFPEVESTEEHLRKLAIRFKADTSIMAYDLFNEPLYFDSLERNKIEVPPIVKRWSKILKMYAPNQLSTIGMQGMREIFEWDPNMLDVDFISFHPYEVEPEQVRNELFWYGKYINKPWIIGETGIPADNDSVTYEEQKKWAHKTLKQAYDCGASGYSWWQYKEVEWGHYHANFLGVVTRKGITKTMKESLIVQGTPKPLTEEFKKFNPANKKDSCICLSNYYNYSQNKEFRIIGRLSDENNIPIEGGVIVAWNQWWSNSNYTSSKKDGRFELLGSFQFYHWMASATEYSMIRADIFPDSAKIYTDSIPTINVGNIKVNKIDIEK